MRQLLFIAAGLAALAPLASASPPPLLPSSQVAAIGNNFADGRHSVQQVAEELSAEYGPVAVDLVLEYLEALKRIGVVE